MTCEQFENQILDYQENRLSPARRAEVESHLAACAACRTFAGQLLQLDAVLSTSVHIPALSAGFDQRLRACINAAPVLSAEQRSERKRQLEAEFNAGMARIGQTSFALRSLSKRLFWPALATLAGWLAWLFTSRFTSQLSAQSPDGLPPATLPLLAASAVFLAVGLARAFPRQTKSLGV